MASTQTPNPPPHRVVPGTLSDPQVRDSSNHGRHARPGLDKQGHVGKARRAAKRTEVKPDHRFAAD